MFSLLRISFFLIFNLTPNTRIHRYRCWPSNSLIKLCVLIQYRIWLNRQTVVIGYFPWSVDVTGKDTRHSVCNWIKAHNKTYQSRKSLALVMKVCRSASGLARARLSDVIVRYGTKEIKFLTNPNLMETFCSLMTRNKQGPGVVLNRR